MTLQFKKNKYTCNRCDHVIITIDLDEGTTPSMLSCKNSSVDCNGSMWSSFYSPASVGDAEPTYEWYRPNREERRRGNGASRQYYKQGGLALRKIEEDGA